MGVYTAVYDFVTPMELEINRKTQYSSPVYLV